MPTCKPGAWPGPQRWIGECIYDGRDVFGLVAGLASLACWVFAQFPQIARNHRSRSAAALSPAFLAEWLAGDTCNLIGCLLLTVQAAKATKDGSGGSGGGGVLKTQTATAAYFICVDCVLILQYVIYGALASGGEGGRRRRERAYLPSGGGGGGGGGRPRQAAPPPGLLAAAGGARAASAAARTAAAAQPWLRALPVAALAPVLLRRPHQAPGGSTALGDAPAAAAGGAHAGTMSAGEAMAWASAVFYLGSRCSQLAKNWARKSVDGLAVSMFAAAITANLLYGASVLARARAPADFAAAAPWLAGSLGTVALDCAILVQAAWLDRHGVGRGSPAGRSGRPGSGGEAEAGGGEGGGGSGAAATAPGGLSLERRPLLSAPVEVAGE